MNHAIITAIAGTLNQLFILLKKIVCEIKSEKNEMKKIVITG